MNENVSDFIDFFFFTDFIKKCMELGENLGRSFFKTLD